MSETFDEYDRLLISAQMERVTRAEVIETLTYCLELAHRLPDDPQSADDEGELSGHVYGLAECMEWATSGEGGTFVEWMSRNSPPVQ